MKTYANQLPTELRPVNAPHYTTEKANTGVGKAQIVLHTIEGSLLFFAIPVSIIMIIIAGAKMVTYGDESEEMTKSKDTLKWNIIGLFVIILSYSIIKIVINLTIEATSL